MSMGISQPSYYVTRLSIPQDIGPLACYAVPASRGEHGGDPSSVEFCHKIGLDYVSCSPFRVPIARLAAAQAAIADLKEKCEKE